ncbi:solute carrier family 22 member 3-like [Styela clava]
MDLDKIESRLSVNNVQILSIISVTLSAAISAVTPQSGVFYNAIPKHRCSLPEFEDKTLFKNASEDEIKSLAIPWDLVWDRRVLNSVLQSLYFVGILVGSTPAGYIFDWFGRRLSLLILSVGLMVSGIGCTFAPTFEVYCIFRFLEGATGLALYGAAFSYANEIAGQKLRITVFTTTPLVTTIIDTLFPMMAYSLRNWRDLNLTCSLLALPFIITWPFIPETPRWLLMKGREIEARKVLNRYARSKDTIIKDEDWQIILETERKKMKFVNTRTHLTDLFRRPFIRIVSLVIMYIWLVANCVYYGLVLNVGSLMGELSERTLYTIQSYMYVM